MIHELKCWPQFYGPVEDGSKPFEIRHNDRDYKKNDVLHLLEFDPNKNEYTGRECWRKVTYITTFAQKPGNIVMGITPCENPAAEKPRKTRKPCKQRSI